MTIREFESGDERAFYELNEQWISHYFVMEKKDKESLLDPRGTILDPGGRIYFAVDDQGEPIGCCALMAMGKGEFEVVKMAVRPAMRGAGVGRQLLAAVIDAGRRLGARRLYLETNERLTPAIRLYESLGFRHLPPDRVVPSPYARANVYMELMLEDGRYHSAS